MTAFDQRTPAGRCEWASTGHDALAPADVVIIVDVLSFSTCVDIAVGRGAAILPYAGKSDAAAAFAADQHADLAGPRGTSRYSLSPRSFLEAPAGLRCVLPSPNGAALALRATGKRSVVLAGCLRNATAVAKMARRLGHTFNVCPAGERWPDGSLRPAVEDWLGAGAILRWLPGTKSPEAAAAIAAFEQVEATLLHVLLETGSGRELVERGFGDDVEVAAAFDVSGCAPGFDGAAFINSRDLIA